MPLDQLKRRDFIALLGSTAAWPLAAHAQQPERMRRIGVLTPFAADDPEAKARVDAFVQALQQLGWSVGRNVQIDIRWGAGDAERTRHYAAELVALAPDAILAAGGATVGPLLQATRSVPIVFTLTPDPVGAGFVDSLAHPGGNATGFTNFEYGIGVKWLELLKEIAPRVTRAAVLRDPAIPAGIGEFGAIQANCPIARDRASPDRHARSRRDRTRRDSIRALLEWRIDSNVKRVGNSSSRSDHRVGLPAPIARRLSVPSVHQRRRSGFLWARYH